MKLFCKCLKNVDIMCFISIFCQRIRVINLTFCYTADKLESEGKTLQVGGGGESEKMKTKKNGHPDVVYTVFLICLLIIRYDLISK